MSATNNSPATGGNPATTPQKAILKSADADPGVAQKKDSVPAAGSESKTEQPAKLSPTQGGGDEGKEGEKEGGGQSESLVRDSYLPANKLKDAPPASEYEGKDPEQFMKTKGPGLGEQIGEKMQHLKDKVTPNKDK